MKSPKLNEVFSKFPRIKQQPVVKRPIKKQTRLTEFFRFMKNMIDEATFDWNKFKDTGKPTVAKQGPAVHGSEYDPQDKRNFMMSKDFEEKPAPPTSAVSDSHPADYHHLAPIPTESGSADSNRLAKAKSSGGFGKMTNWIVSAKHWGKATQGEKDAVNLEGPDFVKPKTDAARQVVRILNLDKLRMTDMVKPEIWKKHFEHKFGPKE